MVYERLSSLFVHYVLPKVCGLDFDPLTKNKIGTMFLLCSVRRDRYGPYGFAGCFGVSIADVFFGSDCAVGTGTWGQLRF